MRAKIITCTYELMISIQYQFTQADETKLLIELKAALVLITYAQ